MGHSLRSKKGRALRTWKRSKLDAWNKARTQALHDKMQEIVSQNPTVLEQEMKEGVITPEGEIVLDKTGDQSMQLGEEAEPQKRKARVVITMELESNVTKQKNQRRIIARTKKERRQGETRGRRKKKD